MKNLLAAAISALAAFFALYILKKHDNNIRADWKELDDLRPANQQTAKNAKIDTGDAFND